MKSYLCDTQLLVWMALYPEHLPKAAVRVILDAEAVLYFSQVSIWEVAIKFALSRRDFAIDPRLLSDELLDRGLLKISIENEHLYATTRLPHLHRDPFDRLLVAQAQVEGLTLMTTDKTLAKYGDWVKRY